jgi:hypothetical protein
MSEIYKLPAIDTSHSTFLEMKCVLLATDALMQPSPTVIAMSAKSFPKLERNEFSLSLDIVKFVIISTPTTGEGKDRRGRKAPPLSYTECNDMALHPN